MPAYSGNRIDTDLIPSNIKNGVNIFWVVWNYIWPTSTYPYPWITPTNNVVLEWSVFFSWSWAQTPSQITTYDYWGFWYYINFLSWAWATTTQSNIRIDRVNKITWAYTTYVSTWLSWTTSWWSFVASNYINTYDLWWWILCIRVSSWSSCALWTRNYKIYFNMNTNTYTNFLSCISDADPDFSSPAVPVVLSRLVNWYNTQARLRRINSSGSYSFIFEYVIL